MECRSGAGTVDGAGVESTPAADRDGAHRFCRCGGARSSTLAGDVPASAATSRSSASDGRWWREEAESTVGNPDQALESRSVSPQGEIVLSSQILAMVGTQPILAGELLGRVNELLAPYVDQMPESQLQEQRWLLMQKMLPSAVEAKLVYLDFLRTMPDKQVELVRSNVYEQFDKDQLPRMVEQAKLKSSAELDAKMRALGSSLDNTRRAIL